MVDPDSKPFYQTKPPRGDLIQGPLLKREAPRLTAMGQVRRLKGRPGKPEAMYNPEVNGSQMLRGNQH